MPTVVNTETRAARKSSASIARSRSMRARRPARRLLTPWLIGKRPGEQVVDLHADVGVAGEHRAFLHALHALGAELIGLRRQRHVLHLLRQLRSVRQVVLDELP